MLHDYLTTSDRSNALGFKPAPRLEQSMTNIPSECRTASIGPNHAMILPSDANPKPDAIFGKGQPPEIDDFARLEANGSIFE